MNVEEIARERRRRRLQEGGEERLQYILGQRDTPVPAPVPVVMEQQPQPAAQVNVGRVARQQAEYRRHVHAGRAWALWPTLRQMFLVLVVVAAWRFSRGRSFYRVDGFRLALVQPLPTHFTPHVGDLLVVGSPDDSISKVTVRVVSVGDSNVQEEVQFGVVSVSSKGGLWHPPLASVFGTPVFTAGPLLLLTAISVFLLLLRWAVIVR